ncbi:hypothetical protein [Photobacterium sp. GSS17]|uniref:hypothetical protein n=1 Tax=Photobacterium sp. GSS17 TaxID=3020715 RepID=UPI002360436A|nr:hypothetical protein [Photobacterium sp. GSS17]
MAITQQQCEQMIQACFQAELDVLDGKTTSFGGRTVTMENLTDIRKARQEWEQKLATLKSGGSRVKYGLARF